MWAEFKSFLLRGNLIDLATAFILGVAFAAVVDAFTNGIVMQLVAAVVGEPNFDEVTIMVGDTPILVGSFFTALVNFLLIAAVIFILVRVASHARRRPVEDTPTPDSDEVVLLREIRDALASGR